MKKDLILVKLGGSVITDKSKPFTANFEIINRLAREISEARKKSNISLIVGHGGGSFPHVPAHKYQTQKGIINEESYRGLAIVQDAAARLNRIIVDSFLKIGENAISIQPSAGCIAEDDRIIEWNLKPIEKILEYGMLPIVYGDVGIDLKKGCCILSTEEILNYLAKHLKAKKLIMAGIVDGVFTADPQVDPKAKLIPEITLNNFGKVKLMLGGSAGIDVTGGMLHKVEKMLELAELGIESIVVSTVKPGILKRALLGEKGLGTIIKA